MNIRFVLVLAIAFLGLSFWMTMVHGCSHTRENSRRRDQLEASLGRLSGQLQGDRGGLVRAEQLGVLESAVRDLERRSTEYSQTIALEGLPLSSWIRSQPDYLDFEGSNVDLYSEIANDLLLLALTAGIADPETAVPLPDRDTFEAFDENRRETEFLKAMMIRQGLKAMAITGVDNLLRLEWLDKQAQTRFGEGLVSYPLRFVVRCPESAAPLWLRQLVISDENPPYFTLKDIEISPVPQTEWDQITHRFDTPPIDVDITLVLLGAP